uniref:Uncharacterized protein n=1 Tax=Strongyloides papillosus TaxID=174720 RepID=A0A0N5CIW5_STREA
MRILWRTVKERKPLTPTYRTFLRACYDIIITNVNSISGSLPSQPSTPPIACLLEASFNHIESNNTKQYSSKNEEPISFGLVEEPIFSELIEPIFPGL